MNLKVEKKNEWGIEDLWKKTHVWWICEKAINVQLGAFLIQLRFGGCRSFPSALLAGPYFSLNTYFSFLSNCWLLDGLEKRGNRICDSARLHYSYNMLPVTSS